MTEKRDPKAPISLSEVRAGKAPKPQPQAKKRKPRADATVERTSDWWYQMYLQRGVELGTFNIYKLPGWCRATDRLDADDPVPHERTLEKWCSQQKWVEKRKADLAEIAERVKESLIEQAALRGFSSYRDLLKLSDDLTQHAMLFLNVPEVYDDQLGWIERKDPFGNEERPTRLRVRLPSEFGGRPYNHANMQRVIESMIAVRKAIPGLIPAELDQPEEMDERDALTMVVPDKAQIAELAAGFGKVVEALVDKTEKRRVERGLNSFGEKIEVPALDAPGRDMLELDEELGPDEEWVTETIEVEDGLPQGVYRNAEGEILPIGMVEDGEGSWDSGGE